MADEQGPSGLLTPGRQAAIIGGLLAVAVLAWMALDDGPAPPSPDAPTANASAEDATPTPRGQAARTLHLKTPEEAATAVGAGLAQDQFAAAFAYGVRCGETMELEEVVARSSHLEEHLRNHFLDGSAQGRRAPVDDPSVEIAAIVAAVPVENQQMFHAAAIARYTREHLAEKSGITEFAQQYATSAGIADPRPGVAAGVQQAFADDVEGAAKTALEFPEDWRGVLLEEIAWRAADSPDRPTDELVALADGSGDSLRCYVAHGAMRGRALRQDWSQPGAWEAISGLRDAFGSDCHTSTDRAVGWAIFLRLAHSPDLVGQAMGQLPEGDIRDTANHLFQAVKAGEAPLDPLAPLPALDSLPTVQEPAPGDGQPEPGAPPPGAPPTDQEAPADGAG